MDVKLVAVIFSILGFICNLAVLGIVVDRIRNWLDRWHSLYSRVVQNGHTVILGWNDKTLFLLQEILTRNLSRNKKSCIVLLTDENKFDIIKRINNFCSPEQMATVKLIVAAGDMEEIADLKHVSISSADRTYILGSTGEPRKSDQQVNNYLYST